MLNLYKDILGEFEIECMFGSGQTDKLHDFSHKTTSSNEKGRNSLSNQKFVSPWREKTKMEARFSLSFFGYRKC